MGQLWAVVGDPNSHGGGELTLSGDSSPGTVFINNIPVIVGTTDAGPDGLAAVSYTHLTLPTNREV